MDSWIHHWHSASTKQAWRSGSECLNKCKQYRCQNSGRIAYIQAHWLHSHWLHSQQRCQLTPCEVKLLCHAEADLHLSLESHLLVQAAHEPSWMMCTGTESTRTNGDCGEADIAALPASPASHLVIGCSPVSLAGHPYLCHRPDFGTSFA